MARGIYKIINVINNKFYVGSAVDLKRRRTRHFSELRTGKHNNNIYKQLGINTENLHLFLSWWRR